MEKIWVIAVSLFVIITFLFWRLTNGYFKKESRLVYWQVVIYAATGITILIMFLLKWTNVMAF